MPLSHSGRGIEPYLRKGFYSVMGNNQWFNVPDKYKPVPFWSWNDKLDINELNRQIDEFKDKGYGGFFMHSRVGLVTGYMSEDWMELIKACTQKAVETNMDAWLYDEDKWPSGFAGGEVPKANNEYGSRNLMLLLENEVTNNDTVIKTYTYDDICFYICKRIEAHIYKVFNDTCYIDAMNEDAVACFIDHTHERYKEAVGEHFGSSIKGIFTDEPAYHMYNLTTLPSLPWSEKLPSYFEKANGYSIYEHIEELFFDVGDYKKLRYDFFKSASKLFLESYTIQYATWCKKNNIKMTGHYMFEDEIGKQIKFIGHAMPHYVHMDIPGVDKLRRHIEQLVTIKQLVSVKEQFNKEQALCEIFGCIGQNSSFNERKWISDWAAVLGISLFNSHLSLYSMRGERKRDYPPTFSFHQPWWDEEKEFSDYLSRISALAAIGKSDANILIVHPVESGWCVFSTRNARLGIPDGTEIYNIIFEQISKLLTNAKIPFHYGDEEIMAENAYIRNGNIVIGDMEYSTVLIPKCLTIRKTTVDLLKEFKGEIISVSGKPKLTDGVEIMPQINYTHNFIKPNEAVAWILDNKKNIINISDRTSGKPISEIWTSRRIDNNKEYIFFANTSEKKEFNSTISITTDKTPYLIDLNSGNIYQLLFKRENGNIIFNTTFCSAGSMAILLDNEKIQCAYTRFLKSGVCFNEFTYEKNITAQSIDFLEDNVLPLEKVDFELNGETILSNEHISSVWNRYFYDMPDDTPFGVKYRFNVESIPEGEVYAVIEVAENLNSIELNGKKLSSKKNRGELGAFNKEKSWKDVNFTKVSIKNCLKLGENVLKIYGKKCNNITDLATHLSLENSKEHFPTEAETVYIVGNFAVNNIDNRYFSITEPQNLSMEKNLTDSGYPFYAGKAKYTMIFNSKTNRKTQFKINNPVFASARIYINKKECDVIYSEPYIFNADIKEGENVIEIVIATTLYNLMGPNWNVDMPDSVFTGPVQFIDKSKYSDKLSLLPFGLDGISEIYYKK